MKKRIVFMTFTCFLVGLLTSVDAQKTPRGGGTSMLSTQSGWYERSFALVIGINAYSQGWGRLSAGVSDAKKMSNALSAQGFMVYELFDKQATNGAIISRLRQAAQQAGPNDRFVFYFSGHGHTQKSAFDKNEIGYLVPVEGKLDDTTSYIPMEQLRTEILNNCAAKHVLVVLDTCFSGTLLTRSMVAETTISDYLSKRGIYGITAGMLDQAAIDGLFTNILVEGMMGNADYNGDGYVTFKELGMYAENNVKKKNSHQTPDYGVMYGAGQIIFSKLNNSELSGTTSTPTSMVLIPGGFFYMGCVQGDNNCDEDEKPQRKIKLNPFYLDVHEVTVSEYKDCVSAGACTPPVEPLKVNIDLGYGMFNNWDKPDRMQHPVNRVFWEQAEKYCSWKGKRLPTEAEFEKALRGGIDNTIYPWGNSSIPPDAFGNYYDISYNNSTPFSMHWVTGPWPGFKDGYATTAPVCSFTRNSYGLCDISGNVAEWCEDFFSWDDNQWYSKMPSENPINMKKSDVHICRGSSFLYGTEIFTRASERMNYGVEVKIDSIGFRCAKNAK